MSKYSKRKRQRPIWVQEENALSTLLENPLYDDLVDDLLVIYHRCPEFTISDGYEPLGGFTCNSFEEFVDAWLSGDYELSEYWEGFDPLDV